MPPAPRRIFITGSTGYLGRALSEQFVSRGHDVDALCRANAIDRLAAGVNAVIGDPLDASTYAKALRPDHVVVHLVGTPKPAPWKGESFRRIDLGSVQQLVRAVTQSPVSHIVYVSVAHPAPTMHAYIDARQRAEAALRETKIPLTILRPWYVLGPGHRWPYALLPFYWAAERIPPLRDGAQRLGLVTLTQMIAALVNAVETAKGETRIWEVPRLRSAAKDVAAGRKGA